MKSILEPKMPEAIDALREIRAVLVRSFTDQCGRNKGKITEPGVRREIECIDLLLELLGDLELFEKNRKTILRALFAYDTEASHRAYEAIHFSRH